MNDTPKVKQAALNKEKAINNDHKVGREIAGKQQGNNRKHKGNTKE